MSPQSVPHTFGSTLADCADWLEPVTSATFCEHRPALHFPDQLVCHEVGLPSEVQRPVIDLPSLPIVSSTAPASFGPFLVGSSVQRPVNLVTLAVPEMWPESCV